MRKQKSVYDKTFTKKIQEELLWLQQQKAAMEELAPDRSAKKDKSPKHKSNHKRPSLPTHPERVANQEISLAPIKHTYGVPTVGRGTAKNGDGSKNPRARLLTDATNGRRLSKMKAVNEQLQELVRKPAVTNTRPSQLNHNTAMRSETQSRS